MAFKVLRVFANAGLQSDDEIYVVVEVPAQGVAREVYTTRQSALGAGHNAETLGAAFTLAWRDVRAPRAGVAADAHWQLKVRRHPEFDGGQSGWEPGERIYATEGEEARDQVLFARRLRHAGYLLALHPRHLQKYSIKAALNEAAQLPAKMKGHEPPPLQAQLQAPLQAQAPVQVYAPPRPLPSVRAEGAARKAAADVRFQDIRQNSLRHEL